MVSRIMCLSNRLTISISRLLNLEFQTENGLVINQLLISPEQEIVLL